MSSAFRREGGVRRDLRGGGRAPTTTPFNPGTMDGVWLRLLASDATTGSWVDTIGGRSFTGAGTPTIGTDAAFNNATTVTFDGVDDSYTDAGAASAYDFTCRTDTGVPWLIAMCFSLSSPATAAIQRMVNCGDLGTAGGGLQIYKQGVASGATNCGGYNVGNGNPVVSPITTFTSGTRWLVYGFDPSTTGGSTNKVGYRFSVGTYLTKTYSWVGPYTSACNVALTIGKSPNGATQYAPMKLAELVIAKTTLDSTLASSFRTYFNTTYGATL